MQPEKFHIGLPRGFGLQFRGDDVEHVFEMAADAEALQHRAGMGA